METALWLQDQTQLMSKYVMQLLQNSMISILHMKNLMLVKLFQTC